MAEAYRLKTINFLGRRVPIVVQNENGPCPMLALANVLLLRNQIHLSPDAPDVTQERLLSLIAGHLLDANSKQGVSEEQQANMTRIIADAVELLPKLTTGIDVNVMFTDVRGFEYTNAIAIFDLLDIHLVHGWIVDPQDQDTAAAIGSKSYNALMERMVALTGRPSLTPAPSQEPHATAGLLETGTTSAARQKASADDTEDVPAHEGLSEQELQSVSAQLESDDMGMAYAQSSAATGGSKPISSTYMAAQHWDQAASASKSAAAEKPELISKPVAPSQTAEVASHTGHISARPTSPPEELCEADELQLALKLSLNNTEDSAAPSHLTAINGAPDCSLHPPAGAMEVPKSLQPSAVNEAVAMQSAGVHGPTLGHTPALSALQPAEGSAAVEAPMATRTLPPASEQSRHAEMLDHDYVMIAPEEAPADKAGTSCMKSSPGQTPALDKKALAAPGEGFEQLSMPKMGSDSPVGFQELNPRAASTSEAAKRALEALSGDAEASAGELPTDKGQDCVTKPLCSLTDAAAVRDDPSSTAAAAAAEAPADRAADEGADTSNQQAPGLDERAMALLAALPKPIPGVGSTRPPHGLGGSSNTAQSQGADASQQHVASTSAGSPATCTQQTVPGDASGEKPALLHSPASQPDQAGRMGSNKEAFLIQSFLDNASSQLTEHGLVSLHQGLKARQLAVLFRNNHFNTLFKFDDALYLLVTDQGYLHEQDAVWEKLDAIDGNTVYVGGQIHPPDTAADTSAADLQLAMQLQKQEDEEHQQQRLAAQRQQQPQHQGQGQRAPDQAGHSRPPQATGRRSRHGSAPPDASHRHGRGAYESRRHGQAAHASSRGGSSRDCTIM